MRVGGELAVWSQPLVASVATLDTPTIDSLVRSDSDDVRRRRTFGGAARVLFEVDRPDGSSEPASGGRAQACGVSVSLLPGSRSR